MQTSRVILANEPRLLRGMLRHVFAVTPGLEVVAEVPELDALPSAVEESDAQWVIVPIWPEGKVPEALRSLLLQHSTLSVLGIAADGSRARIVGAGSTEETQDRLSLAGLISILNGGR